MTRSCLALFTGTSALVAVVGCAGMPRSLTSLTSTVPTRQGLATARPQMAAEPTIGRYSGFYSRMTRGVGYYWIGFTPANIPLKDLTNDRRFEGAGLIPAPHAGSGDGISIGAGLKFTESARSFMEVAFEKTFNHDLPAGPQNAYHERLLLGGRVAAAPRSSNSRIQNLFWVILSVRGGEEGAVIHLCPKFKC